jgi:preprotein translocase subunit SecF
MKRRSRLTIAAIGLLWFYVAAADEVYKSIDAQGRVTYSAKPPPSASDEMVEEVKIRPGPTEEQVQQAEQQAKALQELTQQTQEQRQEQRQAQEQAKTLKDLSKAEQELRDATSVLKEAKEVQPGSYYYPGGAEPVLVPQHRERVEAARQKVQQAKEAAQATRQNRQP